MSAGGATPRSATLPRLPKSAPLDYGPDASRPLPRVRPEFIAEQLGKSAVPSGAATAPVAAAASTPVAVDNVAKQFRCVNGHQTDDPLSPPCNTTVATSNGGATYEGVTADEVKVVAYIVGGFSIPCNRSPDDPCPLAYPDGVPVPVDVIYDLDKPIPPSDPMFVRTRALRDLSLYFNRRFQTYGRHVHVYAYSANGNDYFPPDSEKESARATIDALHPFAVVVSWTDYANEYSAEVARRGVATFTDLERPPADAAFYARSPNLLWGFRPSIERQADTFASYVCAKVLPYPVSISGNSSDNGKPRKIALLYPYGYDTLAYAQLADRVTENVKACGGTIADRGEFSVVNQCPNPVDIKRSPESALATIARFKQEGITTVLWTGCASSSVAASTTALGYFPEWIVAGEASMEGNYQILFSGLTVPFSKHAILVTPDIAAPPLVDKRCFQAMRQVDPTISTFEGVQGCDDYNRFRQLFASIQLAGPRLGPATLGSGTRTLPRVDSTDPLTPTCFYDGATDTTCIKDATAMYWDATAQTTYNAYRFGCWRQLESGKRYLPGRWPPGNVDAQLTGAEPCNDVAGDPGGVDVPARDYTRLTAGLLRSDR